MKELFENEGHRFFLLNDFREKSKGKTHYIVRASVSNH
jgi:hypothetical protein